MTRESPNGAAPRESLPAARLKGHSICPGVAIGHALTLDREPDVPRNTVTPGQVEAELLLYEDARAMARDQLHEHIEQAHGGSWPNA
ncbi:hypothetical protein K8I85_01685, partial [bacterium]|nr:hypothetical protein [bacterium]